MVHLLRGRRRRRDHHQPDRHAGSLRLPLCRSSRRGQERAGGQGAAPRRRHPGPRHRRPLAASASSPRRCANAACRWAASTTTSARATSPPGPRYVDPTAAATGELIHRLATRARLDHHRRGGARACTSRWSPTPAASASPTPSRRTLRAAAALLELGVDTEQTYVDIYASRTDRPAAAPRRGAADAGGRGRLRARVGHGAAGGIGAARCRSRRPRRDRRACPLGEGGAAGAALPRNVGGAGQGLAAERRQGGCGRAGAGSSAVGDTPRRPGWPSPAPWATSRKRSSRRRGPIFSATPAVAAGL